MSFGSQILALTLLLTNAVSAQAGVGGMHEEARAERLRVALKELESGPRAGERRVDPETALLAVEDAAVARIAGVIEPGKPLRAALVLNGAEVQLDLLPNSVRAPGFTVGKCSGGGPCKTQEPGPVRTLRGSIPGIEGVVVLGVVKPSGLELTIHLPGGKVVEVEPLSRQLKGVAGDSTRFAPATRKQVGPVAWRRA